MSKFYYLDVSLKLASEPEQLQPVYFKSCLERSLVKIFGEIGGLTTLDVLKFDAVRSRAIVRVPVEFYVKLRTAITLTGEFQDIDCAFVVNKAAPLLLGLTDSFLEL
ncbi:ribonuclease P protein subunit p14-like isoform X6 [Toxorhynchites rutilus septentrionalis]|uniref:ribonuclease P protein subunit p14-like isoform X6 n=1 Tax=Toxorhynchites rutilus septentrionalis TaxID=329112 RepID=UPI002479A1A8|nr:ribonuclease P protein subunit p14-like isoform X6 [Toxorhynchites rutilus septentrionalis]